ncbi:MAG TPA: hypothetical protein VI006_11610 [Solirubrobacteraceae bacterium]
MSAHIATQELINEARACIWRAVKIDPGRRALEGDLESAYSRLEAARTALEINDIGYARRALTEALDLLRTDEARLIAQDSDALEDAIRIVSSISWD